MDKYKEELMSQTNGKHKIDTRNAAHFKPTIKFVA
jgi:hypothetical protein